jgi:outer membrane protein
LALSRNGNSLAAEQNAAATIERARAATAFALPQLTGNASAGVADGTFNPARQPGEDLNRYGVSGQASQLLFGFGVVSAARKGAQAQRDAGRAQRDLVRRDLAFTTRSTVTGVLFARELVGIADARIAQRKSERDDAAARFRAGLAAESERRQGDIAVANAEDGKLQASAGLESQTLALAELVVEPRDAITVTGTLTRPADLLQLVAKGESNIDHGAELAALDAQRRSEEALLAGEKSRRWPTFSAFANGGYSGRETDDLNDGWEAGLRMDWSLYDGGERYALARAATHSAQALSAESEATRLARVREAADLRQRAESLAKRIDLQQQVVELAGKNYEDIRAQYNAGTVTQTRVNEANLVVFEARFTYANLVYQESLLAHEARRLAE